MVKLVVGCGYVGLRVARRWLAQGDTVWATTRSADRARHFEQVGLRPILADVTSGLSLPDDARTPSTVLFALGYENVARDQLETVYVRLLEHVVAALGNVPDRFLYVSSTGVYGQSGGEWVDEQSPCAPSRAGGRAALAAEHWLATSRVAGSRIIMRFAGLYGPGRIPNMVSVQQGQPVAVSESASLNLIHVDDAADVVLELDSRAQPPLTVNVSDGQPVLRADFYRELAVLLHAPAVQFAPPVPGTRVAERSTSDKRVSNRRLQEILNRPLTFPSYREGLRSIVREGAASVNGAPPKTREEA